MIEYWEKFASHAFENTATSVFSHCVLLKPSGEPIPCTFCFSIRRDIFDLPSVVIGEFRSVVLMCCFGFLSDVCVLNRTMASVNVEDGV